MDKQTTIKQGKPQNKGANQMFLPTLIMGLIAVLLIIIGVVKGQNEHIEGMSKGFRMTITILPMLIFAFIAAGMIQVLIPHEILTKWIGKESGIKGIFIGTIVGAFTPGGPYVSLLIVAGLLRFRCGRGSDGRISHGLVPVGCSASPHGCRDYGMEVYSDTVRQHIFSPPIAGLIAHWIALRFS